eukprot:2654950-Amphidinium_carterae.1
MTQRAETLCQSPILLSHHLRNSQQLSPLRVIPWKGRWNRQHMAIVRAKNAAGTVLSTEAPIGRERMIGVLSTEEPIERSRMIDRGPVSVMKPPPTSTPKVVPGPFLAEPYRSDDDEPAWTAPRTSQAKPPPDWQAKTAEAAMKARAVIAKAKEVLYPTEPPHYKPPPKAFGPQQAKGKPPPPPCPILGATMKSPPARISARIPGAEKAAMDRAKARQDKSPPSKGFVENYVNHMMEQPALLPGNMILSQSEAINLAMQAIPTSVSSQVLTDNGQVMIALTSPGGVVSAGSTIDPRWGQPSEVVMKHRCHFCKTQDAPNLPLKMCWYEDALGRKCGKRFCFKSCKKCGAQLAYNIKPPSPSGLKDFPVCLWCKEHDHIAFTHEGYKLKIGAREDWYHWDPVEAYGLVPLGPSGSVRPRTKV